MESTRRRISTDAGTAQLDAGCLFEPRTGCTKRSHDEHQLLHCPPQSEQCDEQCSVGTKKSKIIGNDFLRSIDIVMRTSGLLIDAPATERGFGTCAQLATRNDGPLLISTGATNLDQLLGGGVRSCSITELFGEPRSGKTQVCHSLAVTAQLPSSSRSTGGKVVYIDTEGTFRPERIRQIAEFRGIQAEMVMDNIIYARCYTSEHLASLVESMCSLISTDDQFALVVVDSIVGVFCSDYLDAVDLLTCQQSVVRVMRQLQWMSEDFNVAVVVTNQVIPDTCAREFLLEQSQPVGGHILGHFSTTWVSLRIDRADRRIAMVSDSACRPDGECVLELFSGGVRSASD